MPPPIFGVNCWIWESPVTTEVIATLAPKIKAWGFDLIEMPLEGWEDWEPERVRDILVENDLRASVCIPMIPGRSLISNHKETVIGTQSYLRTAIDAAAIVGSPMIAGPIYNPTGDTWLMDAENRRDLMRRLIKNLRRIVEYGEQAGVAVAIEPLNRFETSFFNTVEQTMELIDAVNHPSIGLLLDTFHMNIEECDPAAAIRLASDRLFHFHACGNDRGAPGPGTIPWPAIRDALNAIDYSGALVIESFTSANAAIATAASIWRPLADSQDQIATEGLAFLRNLFGENAP